MFSDFLLVAYEEIEGFGLTEHGTLNVTLADSRRGYLLFCKVNASYTLSWLTDCCGTKATQRHGDDYFTCCCCEGEATVLGGRYTGLDFDSYFPNPYMGLLASNSVISLLEASPKPAIPTLKSVAERNILPVAILNHWVQKSANWTLHNDDFQINTKVTLEFSHNFGEDHKSKVMFLLQWSPDRESFRVFFSCCGSRLGEYIEFGEHGVNEERMSGWCPVMRVVWFELVPVVREFLLPKLREPLVLN